MEMERKFDELGRVVQEFKTAHEKEIAEIKKNGHAANETIEKVSKLNDEITRLENEVKSVQVAMQRSAKGEEQATEKKTAHSKLLDGYLRKGRTPSAEEFKAMSVDSDEDGGFLVSPEMSNEIVKQVYESSPMRELSSVITISSDSFKILQDLSEAGAGWVGEIESRSETSTPSFKEIMIPVHELQAMPKATQKLLDDASIDIESYLAGQVAEKFKRSENTAFVSGNGVNKPKGILSYTAGTSFGEIEQVTTAGSLAIAADDMMEICYKLKGAYKPNAKWLMKRETVKVLRKLKGSDGQYLWAPGVNGLAPSMFLGHEIFEADDMQAQGVANNLAIAFGDFKQGYQIVDRMGIRVIRDIYTAKPHVLFYTTKRVGGGVKNFEAIKLLKVKA